MQFSILLNPHRLFGYIVSCCFVEADDGGNTFYISSNFLEQRKDNLINSCTPLELQIIKLAASFSEENLFAVFSHKGKTRTQFLKQLTPDIIQTKIKPFISKRLNNLFDLIAPENFLVFLKEKQKDRLYAWDLITTYKNKTEIVFNIKRTNEGTRYFISAKQDSLSISLYHQRVLEVSLNPCMFIINNKLYRFENVNFNLLMPFIRKPYILIKKIMEEKWYDTFGRKIILSDNSVVSGVEIEKLYPPRKCVLKFEVDWQGVNVFIPKFEYGNKSFFFNEENKKILTFNREQISFTLLERDKNWENEIIEYLKFLGLQPKDANNFILKKTGEDSNFKHQNITWISVNKSLLEKKNIFCEQKLYKKKYFTDTVSLEFRAGQKKDWFDINAFAIFGVYKISFRKLKKNLLNRDNEFLLPNGEIAIIPDSWFARYTEMMQYVVEKNGKLLLRACHFSLIENENIISEDKSFLKSWENLKIPEKVNLGQPFNLKAQLRHYQLEGFRWMTLLRQNNLGACLADDMGLGKTIQTIATIIQTIEDEGIICDSVSQSLQLDLFESSIKQKKAAACLIIMPVSLLYNWQAELTKFAPHLKVLIYKGVARKQKLKKLQDYDVILSGYATARNDASELAKNNFLYLILDESQFIKNANSKTYKELLKIEADYKLILTGTPIENSLSDLWAQMNFINHGLLGNQAFFQQTYKQPIEHENDEIQSEKLQHIISPFLLRRTKKQAAPELPDITIQTITCSMSPTQEECYVQEKSKIRNQLLAAFDAKDKKNNAILTLKALTKLRQLAIHPVLVFPDFKEKSGKFTEIIRTIKNLSSEGRKLLLFSSYTKHLNLIALQLQKKEIKYALLTGKTKNRQKEINYFKENKDVFVFLISLKAGGTGLNLTEADTVIISDPWWNPAAEKQAIDRVHRIGQDKKITVLKYISKNSIEEKIAKIQQAKTNLADQLINQNNPLKRLNKREIINLL